MRPRPATRFLKLRRGAKLAKGEPSKGLRRPGMRKWPTQTGFLPIAAVIAATQFAWSGLIPFLPAHSSSLGASAAQIGIVIAGFGVGRLLVDIPAGFLATRGWGLVALLSGALGVTVTVLVAAAADSLPVLIVLRVLMGVGAGVALTCGVALIGNLTDAGTRGRMVSRLQLFQLTATIAGPVTGGLIAARFGSSSAFVCVSAAAALVIIVASYRLPWRSVGGPGRSESSQPERARTGPKTGLTVLLAASAVGFALFLTRFGGEQTLVPLVGEDLGLGVSQLGLLLSAMSVCQVLGVLVSGQIYDRLPRKLVTLVSTGLLAVALAGLGASPTLVVFVTVALLLGLVQGVAVPASSAYLIDVTTPARMGFAVGVYRSFGDLAAIVGPIAVGLLITVYSGQVAALVLASTVLVIVVLFRFLGVEPRRGDSAHP